MYDKMRKWEEIFLGFLFHQIRVKQKQYKRREKNWLKINIWFLSSCLSTHSFCVLFSNRRRRWRWRPNTQRESRWSGSQEYRYLLHLGLLLVLVKIPGNGRMARVWSIRWIIHYTLYCYQYTLHGTRSSQHG